MKVFWNRLRRKKDTEIEEKGNEQPLIREEIVGEKESAASELDLKQEEIRPLYKSDQKRFVRDCCESISENDRQILAARMEYEQVTGYLTDIQKIDRIEGEAKTELCDICKKIQTLLKERNQYKNRNLTITEPQIRRFDRFHDGLEDQLNKMYQAESYQKDLVSDMGHLEEEKNNLLGQRKEIVRKQNALKGMAKILSVLIFSIVILFVALYVSLDIDMTLPYLGTLLLAAVSATVIFIEANKNRREMILTERKLSKAIGLMNRVKIKYINNVSMMEYDCQKYGVKDAADFESIWIEYCRAKEYERKFRENTDQLDISNENLLAILKGVQVGEPDVWLSQTDAITDSREMVEIRHELNQRRQKLRDRITYNTKLKESFLVQIDELIEANSGMKKELLKIVKEYNQEEKRY